MADPFDVDLREKLIQRASELNLSYHPAGTISPLKGRRFSTRAESNMFRIGEPT